MWRAAASTDVAISLVKRSPLDEMLKCLLMSLSVLVAEICYLLRTALQIGNAQSH